MLSHLLSSVTSAIAAGSIVSVGAMSAVGAAVTMADVDGASAAGIVLEVERISDAEPLGGVTMDGPADGLRAPGHVETVAYTVTNGGDTAGELIVGIAKRVGIEDGCTSGAERAADDDCATDVAGDLLGQYDLSVTAVALADGAPVDACEQDTTWATGDVVEVLHGRLDALDLAPVATGLTVDADARACVRATGTFLSRPDNNLAMGDDVDVALRLTIAQA